MKTAVLAAVVTAVILFLAFFKVDVTLIRKSAVEKRAEELTHSEKVDAVAKFVDRKNAAYLWAESAMTADCYRQATAESVVPNAQVLDDCQSAIHRKSFAPPFLSVKVAPRFERSR
jgi:hypothetical protein